MNSIPPLVIGRWYWDWWLVWKALSSGAALVDCTPSVAAIHQNHDYAYHPEGWQGTAKDAVARRNFELAGNGRHLCNLEDATYELIPNGRFRRISFRRQRFETRKFVRHQFVRVWYSILDTTYRLRHAMGLSREGIAKLRGRTGSGSNLP